jgi:DNA-3-methyladenine glycosylase
MKRSNENPANRAVPDHTRDGVSLPPAPQPLDASALAPLARSFFEPSARTVAPLLLGHWLVRRSADGLAGGIIVETEAYLADDPACHAYRGESRRNRAMFGPPGHAYVYFIYGNHWCFNAVCRPAGIGEAVLIRAIEPAFGLQLMQSRRAVPHLVGLTNGPAKFCQAMEIDRRLDAVDLCDAASDVFVAENSERLAFLKRLGPVVRTTRIGITQAAHLPLRFYLGASAYISKPAPRQPPE